MKKLLILIAFAAVYLHFYPNETLNSWFSEQKEAVVTKVAAATDTKIKLKAEKIFTDLKSDFASFSQEEIAELKKITASRESVKRFYQEYCRGGNSNPIFHYLNEEKICRTISHYESLL